MRPVPDRISREWIDSLTDQDLVDIEHRLHDRFMTLERREKKTMGARYTLMRAPADLLDVWDKWSRILNAARERALVTRKLAP